MDQSNAARRRIFFEAHHGLRREAPGSDASTARALALARGDASTGAAESVCRALDLACGPGMQTLALGRLLPDARIVALDLHEPFLRDLGERARAEGIRSRIDPLRADLGSLPFPPGVFDLVWCEGGAYLVGVEPALVAWRELLAPGGRIAFTDLVWLRDDPPQPVRAFWRGYSGMRDPGRVREVIRQSGLTLLGDFILPQSDWWDDYYGPLERRVGLLCRRYATDALAMEVLAGCQAEIDLYRQYADCYGYAFFVASA